VVPGLLPGRRVVTFAARLPLEELVDPRVGLITSCTRFPKDRREPARPIVYQATVANFDYRKAPELERMATGKGRTSAAAARGAIVEALERYCASSRRPDDLVHGRDDALDGPAIAPEELVLYSERQYGLPGFRHRRPVAGEELTWVRGVRLRDGQAVYVPASFVYMNHPGPGGRELFATATSNGLAGGSSLPSAVLAGLYELVERDAFLIGWLARLPAPRIELSEPSLAAEVRRHYCRFGVETIAFDITTDLEIPVVMAVAFDRTGAQPAASVGLGCNLDPLIALERAVMEVSQIRSGAVPWYRSDPAKSRSYEQVHTLEDHAAFAAHPANLAEFEFLLDGPVVDAPGLANRAGGSVEADLEYCRERLEAAGCTVGYVDLTLPDLEPYGIHIVRAIATGLQPMHFGYGEERLGGRRPFTVPRVLGHTRDDLTEDDLNRCPHPLA
jgi:ribosomal protein S12 methylthiotransferase accessory factor